MHDNKYLVKMEDRSVENIQVDVWCTESKRMKIQKKKKEKEKSSRDIYNMCYPTSCVIVLAEEKE